MTGPTHLDQQRALGRLEGTVAAMEKRMDDLETTVAKGFEKVGSDIKDVAASIRELREHQDRRLAAIEAKELERKGAWKVIALVASGVSAIVASAVKYLMG